MKVEVQTVVLMMLVVVFALWVGQTRRRPTMRQVAQEIFGGTT